MSDTNDDRPQNAVKIPAEQARGARWGRPVLYVLIGSFAGAVIAVFAVWATSGP